VVVVKEKNILLHSRNVRVGQHFGGVRKLGVDAVFYEPGVIEEMEKCKYCPVTRYCLVMQVLSSPGIVQLCRYC